MRSWPQAHASTTPFLPHFYPANFYPVRRFTPFLILCALQFHRFDPKGKAAHFASEQWHCIVVGLYVISLNERKISGRNYMSARILGGVFKA